MSSAYERRPAKRSSLIWLWTQRDGAAWRANGSVGAGGRSPVEEAEDSNFVYYTRYFSGQRPRRYRPRSCAMGLFSILTLDGDNDTWSITLYTSSKNKAMRTLRDPATFHRVVAACPEQAHWLDGEPLTPILPMAGILDRYRRFVVDDRPVVTGFCGRRRRMGMHQPLPRGGA